MLFSDLVEVFERIEQSSSRTEITKELAAVLQQVAPSEAQIIIYLSTGLLYSVYRGTQFNLALRTLDPVLEKICNADKQAWLDAKEKYGDFGSLMASFFNNQSAHLTLTEVYSALCQIEQIAGNGSKEKRIAELEELLKRVSPLEAKYIVRIILGTLRLGFSDMTLVDALSWMISGNKKNSAIIEDAFNVCADLGLIAFKLKENGLEALCDMKVTPGIPVRLAAAERLATPEEIFEKTGPCVAQPKIDGFRLQVHKFVDENGHTQVRFFSRNLQEKTDVYPELSEAIKHLHAKEFIAEGEAIAYDPNTGVFLKFQETAKRGRKHYDSAVANDYPLKLFFFDLLYIDGQVCMNEAHDQRRKRLLNALKDTQKTEQLGVIDEFECTSAVDVDREFARALEEGLEGIVVKKHGTPYSPGKRNFNWIKLKRKETGELDDTVDCVILGYYFGRGRRASLGVGAVLLGVFNNHTGLFESIAKCGSGPTEAEWRDLKKMCDELKVSHCPADVSVASELTPSVWTRPEHVVVIRADELTRSPLHNAGKTVQEFGYALRFPRIIMLRSDKSAAEVTTVDEIRSLYKLQFSSNTPVV